MNTPTSHPHHGAGLSFGMVAILLWSLSSCSIVFTSKLIGGWQFLGVAALLAASVQCIGLVASGRSLKVCLAPPPKLWLVTLLGPASYALMYTTALMVARSPEQTMGVNLMNYLWPTVTVVFGALLVPGEKFRGRHLFATALAIAGVLIANKDALRSFRSIAPLAYVLGIGAALSWGIYGALISRWRDEAKDYATTTLGFLSAGLFALCVCIWRGEWEPIAPLAWITMLFSAIGPWAGGNMFWELALHRASSVSLGLMGAATPVLSTINLLILYRITDAGEVTSAQVANITIAAFLIAIAVATGALKQRETRR